MLHVLYVFLIQYICVNEQIHAGIHTYMHHCIGMHCVALHGITWHEITYILLHSYPTYASCPPLVTSWWWLTSKLQELSWPVSTIRHGKNIVRSSKNCNSKDGTSSKIIWVRPFTGSGHARWPKQCDQRNSSWDLIFPRMPSEVFSFDLGGLGVVRSLDVVF